MERREDSGVEVRIQATGSSRDLIYQVSDMIGHLRVHRDDDDQTVRVLDFRPSDKNFSKDAGLGVIEMGPEMTMADILDQAKGHLNSGTSIVRIEALGLDEDPVVYTEMARSLEGSPKQVRKALLERAKQAGMTWDADVSEFVRLDIGIPISADEHAENGVLLPVEED